MPAGFKIRQARLARTPAGALLLVLVLTSLVGQALTVPAVARLAGLPALRLLDYNRQVGTFAPLTDAYVRRTLGLPPVRGTTAVTTPVSPQSPVSGGPDVGTASGPADAPITAKHAFNNDDFDHAYAVRGLPFTARTDTTGQSRQSGEPSSCSTTGGTAWYRYTPSRDQTLFADTFGTSYADALGIFTGRSVDALLQVGCASSPTGDAQIGFPARRGTTYWFQIGGTVSGGDLVFRLLPIGTTRQPSTRTFEERPGVSVDGRYVAFAGDPSGPEPGARACRIHPWCEAMFLADLTTGRVQILVSLHPVLVGLREPQLRNVTVSADGRYFAFESDDPELVAHDTNGVSDVFVFDRMTGRVERDSVASDGSEASASPCGDPFEVTGSHVPSLSANSRFVAFESDAQNLDSKGGCNRGMFLHDRLTGRTVLASVGSGGQALERGSALGKFSISADGRYVLFEDLGRSMRVYDRRTHTSKVVPGDAPFDAVLSADGSRVAYLYIESQNEVVLGITAVRTGEVHRVHGLSDGPQSGSLLADAVGPTVSISATGRYVAFSSPGSRLVPGDTNGGQDVFVYDTEDNTFVRVSTTSTGGQYPVDSVLPSISGDGRTTAFVQSGGPSRATGFVNNALLVHHSVKAGAP